MANSEERREARYQRRKAQREQKAQEAGGKSFEEVLSFGNLCRAGKECCNGARWKTSTINFETNLLAECLKTYNALHEGTRKFQGFHSFSTIEHGKRRDIDALPIQERTTQKCLCKSFLTQAYSRSFIYDNSASLAEKGMDFQLKRLKKHLHDHYRKFRTAGGIYQFDFKGYFGSLPHDKIKERARAKIMDDRLYDLFCDFVDDFQKMKTADKTAEYKRGVGLGSEISQIIALDYASPIDHYVKDVRGVHGYGRYMDDGYVISGSLDELWDIKRNLYRLAEELGIAMSDKKNIITPFRHHSFTFLKMRVTLEESGKVTMKLSRKSIKAMRRKLHIFRRWVDEGKLNPEDVFQSYQSWRAHAKRCNSYNTLRAMDERFTTLFEPELAARKKAFRCTMKATKTAAGWIYRKRGLPGEEEKNR
nr:MAG: MatK/TrnK amino terminal region [Bacteriophage sp.]